VLICYLDSNWLEYHYHVPVLALGSGRKMCPRAHESAHGYRSDYTYLKANRSHCGSADCPTPTFTPAPNLFFSDDFNGDAINSSLWYTETAELSVQDGYLYVPRVINRTESHVDLRIEAKLDRQFSIIEFRAVVLHSEKDGHLSVVTSCGDDPSDTTLEISLGFDNRIWGGWHIVDKEIELPWHQPLDLGQVYNVRLVQDGDVVRAYVDDVEMLEPYPCASMGKGKWLVVRGVTFPGGCVEGYFDYVRLWAPR
jgi:hypothetical protein